MKAVDQYHVGMVTDDLDSALSWWSETAGYRWCQELHVENVLVTPDAEMVVPLRFTYSMDAPHVEVIQAVPETIFTPSTVSCHHLGYWTDDIDGDLAALEKAGARIEGRGFWLDGGGPIWAFATLPAGPRIELVPRTSQRNLERWWAMGTMGG